jgi:hypothetical protein
VNCQHRKCNLLRPTLSQVGGCARCARVCARLLFMFVRESVRASVYARGGVIARTRPLACSLASFLYFANSCPLPTSSGHAMQDIETVGHNLQADASSLVNLAGVRLLMLLPVRLSVCMYTRLSGVCSLFLCLSALSGSLLVYSFVFLRVWSSACLLDLLRVWLIMYST